MASMVCLLLACALMQASHGPYYVFFSIHLEDLGYSGGEIGALWALAVVAEVALFAGHAAGARRGAPHAPVRRLLRAHRRALAAAGLRSGDGEREAAGEQGHVGRSGQQHAA